MARMYSISVVTILSISIAWPAMVFAQKSLTPASSIPVGAPVDDPPSDIIVTGTILPATLRETPSPVTVISSEDLFRRGISSITDATQRLAANGSGTLPNSFSANGAFAAGASAPSLRGLTTDSTLVLFNGLRGAYFPLADDAVRNFVDTNTIPEAIVDRVEVLKDGASSTYGADAVAGVINIIFKRQIIGIQATIENGISQRGDTGHQHLAVTFGRGDLDQDRVNAYVSLEYENDQPLFNRDRGFPYNTADYSRLVGQDASGNVVHGQNNAINGLSPAGFLLGSTPIAEVAPATARGNQVAGSNFEPIAGSCGPYPVHTAVDLDDGIDKVCEYDQVNLVGQLEPHLEKFGLTGHVTAKIGRRAEAYAILTYYQSLTSSSTVPANIRGTLDDYSTTNIVLPAVLTAGANVGQLNPNDPFAALGENALIRFRLADIPNTRISLNRTYRGAAGLKGSFGDDWAYSADFTGMTSNLTTTAFGKVYIAGLVSVIADGSYNFVDPTRNSQAVRERISPPLVSRASSSLYQAQASLTKTLFHMTAGDVNLGVGISSRYEGVNDPSANPQPMIDLTQQYLGVNRFGAIGNRWVESAYFEVGGPVLRQLEIDGSGRYDHYSTGFGHFSPKIGVKIVGLPGLAVRGTYSRGFRVPSFAETAQLPVVYGDGYIPSANSYFDIQHLGPTGKPDTYAQTSVLVNVIAGNSSLAPETSRNITAGAVLSPTRWLSLTADYYNIRKDHVIVAADPTAAIIAYYSGQPLPPGFSAILDEPDSAHPAAIPRLLSIQDSFINAQSLTTSGLDFTAQLRLAIGDRSRWTSHVDANYVLAFDEALTDGSILHFAGTLGPIGITAGSGSPRWHVNWQNTIELGRLEATATAYYTSGYRTTAEDATGPGTANDCSQLFQGYYDDGVTPLVCHVRHFVDVDLNFSYQVRPAMKLYTNVRNIADARAPFDPVTYGGNGYNPSWAEAGVVGRYIELGVRLTM